MSSYNAWRDYSKTPPRLDKNNIPVGCFQLQQTPDKTPIYKINPRYTCTITSLKGDYYDVPVVFRANDLEPKKNDWKNYCGYTTKVDKNISYVRQNMSSVGRGKWGVTKDSGGKTVVDYKGDTNNASITRPCITYKVDGAYFNHYKTYAMIKNSAGNEIKTLPNVKTLNDLTAPNAVTTQESGWTEVVEYGEQK